MAAGDGLISMKPTSIVHAGTSAVINADGGVDFTAVTSLSLNGVFTSDYDNYCMTIRYTATGSGSIMGRLRANGSDNTTASSYTEQRLGAISSTVNGYRSSDNIIALFDMGTNYDGSIQHIYGPYLAQPTAFRNVMVSGGSTVRIYEYAGTHNQSTSYDGISLLPNNGHSITGTVHVFGYEE